MNPNESFKSKIKITGKTPDNGNEKNNGFIKVCFGELLRCH